MIDNNEQSTSTAPSMPTRASQVAGEHLIAADVIKRLDDDATKAEIESAVRESVRALGHLVPTYLMPERPVEISVRIADEKGVEAEHTLELTREQGGTPEVVGSALGHSLASALRGFYVGSDRAEYGDAVQAAAAALAV